MAIELYQNPDETVGGLDGEQVMVAPTQGEFDDCCCEDPYEYCSSLGGQSNNAVVSFVATCNGLDVQCVDVAGTLFSSGVGPWVWWKNVAGSLYQLMINCCADENRLCASLVCSVGGVTICTWGRNIDNCPCVANKTLPFGLTWDTETGDIEGTFQLSADWGVCPLSITIG